MELSRMRMACFRAVLLLGLVMVAAVILSRLVDRRLARPGRTRVGLIVAGEVGLLTVVAVAGIRYMGRPEYWWVPWTIAGLGAAAAVWCLVRWGLAGQRQVAVLLLALTVVSGMEWLTVNTIPLPDAPPVTMWRVDLPAWEVASWGTSGEELSAQYPGPRTLTQREARQGLIVEGLWTFYGYDAAFFTGHDTLGGTANLKGQPAHEALMAAATDPATSDAALALLEAPGIGVEAPAPGALPTKTTTQACVARGACGPGIALTPVSYVPGDLVYDITLDHDATMVFNEAYYPGWRLRVCPAADDGSCLDAPTGLGAAGLVEAAIPGGRWTATLTYVLPHWHAYVIAFAVGALAAVFPAIIPWRRSRRRRSGPGVQVPPGDTLQPGGEGRGLKRGRQP
jgi:hypothetical protein